MTFALGFICGIVLGATVTHLAHEWLDTWFEDRKPSDEETPLWMRHNDEEKDK